MSTCTRLATLTVIVGSLFASFQQSLAGTPVYVGSKAAQRVSMDRIDHSTWDALLKKYVDANGMVNYAALKSSPADTRLLDRYLSVLSSGSPSVPASRESKLAFWINAYNAVTVRGILREYPTTSIRNHTAKLWGYNIWNDLQLLVAGKPYSLGQIENEVLRKMSEPRIHFAIVCASIGCPRLLNEAYVADRLEQQLQINTKDFFSRRGNFRFDKNGRRLYLSSILKWYATDFGANQGAQLSRISAWLPTREAAEMARRNAGNVSYLDYDWGLNKQ